MNCAYCGIRKPKRECPGLNGQICSICCGTEREQAIDCPIDCEYLQEAHKHERPHPVDPATLPNQDITLPESFLQANEWLLVVLGSAVADGALSTRGTTDFDIREALESLIATRRSLQSGIIYEARTANPYASAVKDAVENRIKDIQDRITAAASESLVTTPARTIPESTFLSVLVVLQRLEYNHNNGRRRSRAFLDFLLQFRIPSLPLAGEDSPEPELEPNAPRVIL